MICEVCDVWYDPQRGCDHRVILMNTRDGFIKVEKDGFVKVENYDL